jgi:hypothetical protein
MGGTVKKIAATIAAAGIAAAIPLLAAPAFGASPVKDEFLTIGGPKKLEAKPVLRVPIRCSTECNTTAKTRLLLPDTNIPPSTATGHLAPGDPRNLVVSLNDAAATTIQTTPGTSKLRVAVTAISEDSGDRAHAVKIFGFTQP